MPSSLTRISRRVTRYLTLGWTCEGDGGCGATGNADTASNCGGCGRSWG